MQRVNLLPIVMPPPQTRFECSSVIAFCCNPATAIGIFHVEPGGYLLCTARLSNGFCGSFRSAAYSARPSFVVILCENRFGSNVGADASARISPLFGSIEMITPRLVTEFWSC